MADLDVIRRRMSDDWNRRAEDDAEYYVAFGRRRQNADEFFASAADVLRELRREFPRLSSNDPTQLSALEIGCGPGRLMLPLSRDFQTIAGVDVAAAMVERARQNLAAAPNAVVTRTNGSDLSGFADASIDFCYSYAVFQHIPEREVVLSYLREACRVLKPGGILKAQVNSLRRAGDPRPDPVPGWSARAGAPHSAVVIESTPDTWNGVSFCGEEIAAFAREQRLLLLALDGFDTQYLWFTARKPAGDEPDCGPTLILGSSSTAGSDRVIPRDGRFSSAALWVDQLPRQADLNRLRIEVDGVQTAPSYISERTPVGASQVNFFLPPDSRSGALPLRLWMDGMPLSPLAAMLVAPSIPPIPRLLSVTDGVDLLSDIAIQSRSLKVHIEDVPLAHAPAVAAEFEALLGRLPLKILGAFCVDPLARRYELNLEIPQDVPAGPYNLFCRLGARKFPPVALQITP